MFDPDYAESDKYKQNTGWISAFDVYGNGDLGAENGYSLNFFNTTEEDTTWSFKANYITDRDTAEKLQVFLTTWYCNQHTIMDLTLTLKYMYLEVGDVVMFDGLIGNTKAFGEDYSATTRRNGQIIYPYFIITSVTKTLKDVRLKVMQLHKCNRADEFVAQVGDIDRNGIIDVTDFELLSDYVSTRSNRFTRDQLKSMDINQDNIIGVADMLLFAEQLNIDLEE